jgi:hypothetical protein
MFIAKAVLKGVAMQSVKGVYDGKSLKLDEQVGVDRPTEIILTFLSGKRRTNQREITRRQLGLLENGYKMGGLVYQKRTELYGR